MKALILTEGGRNRGFGHITRCSSLYEAFLEYSITPKFIVNGDESVKALLTDKHHVLFNWIEQNSLLVDHVQGTDILIIDSYIANQSLYNQLSQFVKIPAYLDDTKRIDYPRGAVINGSIFAINLGYPERKNIEYLIGPQYILLRKEFWAAPDKPISDEINSILITFGGDDMRNLTPQVLKMVVEVYPDIKKIVIVGNSFKNVQEIISQKDAHTSLIFSPDAQAMKSSMIEADIAISAGGQTINECARIGIPTIAIGVAENQINNILAWEKAGFVLCAGAWNDKQLLAKIENSVISLIPKEIRLKMSHTGKTIVDGSGVKKVVARLLQKI